MRKKWIIRSVIVISIVIITNIPIISFFFSFVIGEKHFYGRHFKLSSGQGGFSTDSSYYENPKVVIEAFERYRLEHPNDSILYRDYPNINPLKFWRWREYIVEDIYRLPHSRTN
jgi:hypothetical protein